MKKLKIAITLLAVLIIIMILAIVFFNKYEESNKYNEEVIMQDEEALGIGEFSEEFLEKINVTELMQVDGCIEKYFELSNMRNSIYYSQNENGEYARAVEDEYIYGKVRDLLSIDYIEENNVTNDNVYDFVEFPNVEKQYTILDIVKIKDTNPYQFATYGIISQDDEFYEYRYFIITIDSANSIFAIEPLENVNDISEVRGNESIKIEKNSNNNIPTISMTAESISKYYFDTMKNILLYDNENAYKYLDEEYANIRFKTEEAFKDYISENSEYVKGLDLTQYKIETIDDELRQDRYLLVDQYKNIYTIETDTVTDFKMKLDTYTIISNKFKETYDSSNEEQKVAMNIDKWIQMINTRDYTNAYNVLDETFRNNNWASEEEFEQYIRELLPLHYDVEYTTYSNEGVTYVQQINLTDITGKAEGTISLNIIMQLKDNYEFVMSFSVQE